jgi:protein ImuB
MGRILYVWSPNWPITSYRRRRPGAWREAEPFALVETEKNARRLRAVNDAAARLGLAPGGKLADALAVAPNLKTASAEPDAEAEALQALCDWCVRYSPAIAVDPPDGLFLEVSGIEALWVLPLEGEGRAPVAKGDWEDGVTALRDCSASAPTAQSSSSREPLETGPKIRPASVTPSSRCSATGPILPLPGEGSLLHDLLGRLHAQGIPAQGAVASTPGAAWALARFAPLSSPDASEAERLAPLPVGALRIDWDTEAGLRRLGLKTIGQVRALPRAQLARRFGQRLLLRLDQAAGELEEALPYRRPPAPFFERLAFFEPIAAPEDLARAAGDVLEKLCAALEARGMGARRFTVAFHRVDGQPLPLTAGTALAGRDPRRLARLFAPKLETVDPGFGLEAVTAEADRVEPLALRQTPLAGAADDEAQAGAADLVDRLKARLGEDAVWRAEVRESWVPERTVAHAQPFAPRSGKQWDPARPRPLRLFERPEPIEAMAPVPDDPPLQFRWRGRLCKVRAAEGPERIAEEWWRRPIEAAGPARVRDYYRVEDAEGRRFWLFRAGLYEPGTPSRWFVHGLFE